MSILVFLLTSSPLQMSFGHSLRYSVVMFSPSIFQYSLIASLPHQAHIFTQSFNTSATEYILLPYMHYFTKSIICFLPYPIYPISWHLFTSLRNMKCRIFLLRDLICWCNYWLFNQHLLQLVTPQFSQHVDLIHGIHLSCFASAIIWCLALYLP